MKPSTAAISPTTKNVSDQFNILVTAFLPIYRRSFLQQGSNTYARTPDAEIAYEKQIFTAAFVPKSGCNSWLISQRRDECGKHFKNRIDVASYLTYWEVNNEL